MLINLFKLFLKLFKLLKFLELFILSSPNFWENLRYEKKIEIGINRQVSGMYHQSSCYFASLFINNLFDNFIQFDTYGLHIHNKSKCKTISSSSSGKQKKQGQLVNNYFTLNKKLSISLHCVLFNYVIFQIRNLIILPCISILIISRLKKSSYVIFQFFGSLILT